MKILVIEDDNSLRELIHKALTDDNHVVETAANAKTAMMKAEVYDYDCILLDIMLPDGNGLDVLRQLKATRKEAGVIIVSAKDSIEDKVVGLDLGADDYLTKPFHIAELSARVKSVFRRKQQHGEHFIELGNVRMWPETRQVTINGQPVELLKKEFDILHFFMTRPDRAVSKGTLAEAVWGDYIDQADNYDFIYAQMKNLRKRLAEAQADIEIKTVHGYGYKLERQ
ncbi:MAG: response regulator transcription factor [Bacteroidales bacterium]|nr:response regulator transcription factor [Bacteroidales bacterium]